MADTPVMHATYEERREAEHAQERARLATLEGIAREFCRTHPEFSIVPSSLDGPCVPSTVDVRRADGASLGFGAVYPHRDRVTVSGDYGRAWEFRPRDNAPAAITCSLSRPAAVIIKEVERRLLAPYLEAYTAALADLHKAEEYKSEKNRRLELLATLVKGGRVRGEEVLSGSYNTRMKVYERNPGKWTVDIRADNLTWEKALEVLALISTPKGGE